MANSTLQAIITKVRRVTGQLSNNQVADADIIEYVNTFMLFDFPEELRLFYLHVPFTWWCEPNIDTYTTDANSFSEQLQNFNNNYVTTNQPAYCAGFKMLYSQSREEFFNYWPFTNAIQTVATGDGATTDFIGTLTSGIPVLMNNVTFSTISDPDNLISGLELHDDGEGNLIGDMGAGPNSINYVTGEFALSFNAAPGNGQVINSMTFPYAAARPTTLLYFGGSFTLRPVPDQSYPINMEVFKLPTQLIDTGQSPQLNQWWQYIAYGAALKLLQDIANYERIAEILPEFRRQELMVLRTTTQQLANERAGTIYTQQANVGGWNSPFGNGIF